MVRITIWHRLRVWVRVRTWLMLRLKFFWNSRISCLELGEVGVPAPLLEGGAWSCSFLIFAFTSREGSG